MKHLALSLLAASLLLASLAPAAILVKIPGFKGDAKIDGYDKGDWFVADSFSFGVEREITKSGKGGTADINIGVGELQEVTISKALDQTSAKMMQFAINGNSAGTAEIHFVQLSGGGAPGGPKPVAYLVYKLDRCFVKSWSTSGDADDRPTEDVSFYFNKIAFRFYYSNDGMTFVDGGVASWDRVKNTPWPDHGIPATPPRP